MSETTGKNVVSLLEEHVDRAISTVKSLRDEKLSLETEITRLNSDIMQRDARIQELEKDISDLREDSELARQTAEEERAGIRNQLETLMAVLADPDAASDDTDDTKSSSESELMFKPKM